MQTHLERKKGAYTIGVGGLGNRKKGGGWCSKGRELGGISNHNLPNHICYARSAAGGWGGRQSHLPTFYTIDNPVHNLSPANKNAEKWGK